MENKLDITKLSSVELKALAYDLLAQLDMTKNNLAVVQEQMKKKDQEQKQPVVEEVK